MTSKNNKARATAFWTLSFTWGLPLTVIGLALAIVLMIIGYKPHRFYHMVYFEIGENWGGFSFGGFMFVSEKPSLHIKQHEAGHGIQNAILGIFMPFIVSIPSAVRYWYREFQMKVKKNYDLPPYDSIWFEGWATALGEKYFS